MAKGKQCKLKTYKFRDVSTGKVAKIKACTSTLAIKKYEKRRKGKYKPNWEFLD